MKNKFERKVQFGGWTKRYYREIRKRLRRFWLKEEGYRCLSLHDIIGTMSV